jgi:hypothetical protein
VKTDPTVEVSSASSPGDASSVAPSGVFTTGGAASFREVHGRLLRAQRNLRESLAAGRLAIARCCDISQDGDVYLRALELTAELEQLIAEVLEDLETRMGR